MKKNIMIAAMAMFALTACNNDSSNESSEDSITTVGPSTDNTGSSANDTTTMVGSQGSSDTLMSRTDSLNRDSVPRP